MGLMRGDARLRKRRFKEWCYRACAAVGVIAVFRRWNRRRLAIVVYHAVTTEPRSGDALEVSLRDFEIQMQTLARFHTVVGFTQALRALDGGVTYPRPPAVVTFDDGYRATVQRALPILRAHGIPAMVFLPCGLLEAPTRPLWHDRVRRAIAAMTRPEVRVTLQRVTRIAAIPTGTAQRSDVTDRLTEWLKTLDVEAREEAVRQIEAHVSRRCPSDPDQDDQALLSWDEVSDAGASGLEFGAHTMFHAILPTEAPVRAQWEIEESKRVLEARLGRPVNAFCYPNGSYRMEHREMVRHAGYEGALTMDPGLNDSGSDRYLLRRLTMNTAEGPYTLLAKLSGFEEWLKRVAAAARLWRPETLQGVEPWDRVIGSDGSARRRRCECVWVPAHLGLASGHSSGCSMAEGGAPRSPGKVGLMHVVHTLMVGGMERLVVDLVDGLSADRYDRYVCCLDQRGPLADELERHGVTVYCLNKGPGVRWGLPWRIRRLIRDLGVTVVHTHNLSGLLYGGLAAELARVKSIVHTEHGWEIDHYRSSTVQRLERLLSLLPDRVVAVSQPLFDELRYVHGIPLNRLLLIGNGVRIERSRTTPPPDLRTRLGIAERDRVIGIIARLVPVKDHHTMFRAMAVVVRAVPEARLLVVGDGPLRAELEAEAARLGIASHVTFLGLRHDIPELLSLLDVFVLSSQSEGMSITILEAMAAKRPVVATDVGGTSWLVHHEKTGLLVPSQSPHRLADAVLRLLNDRAVAAQLGEAGYRLVRERFQVAHVIQQYDAVYRELSGV